MAAAWLQNILRRDLDGSGPCAKPSFEGLKLVDRRCRSSNLRMLNEGEKWTLQIFKTMQFEVLNGSGPSSTKF